MAGAGAQRSSAQNSPAPGSPQVLPSTYSPISTFSSASTSTFAASSGSVLPPGGITATPRPSTGYTTAYPTAASPYASASSMAATSSHFPTAAQTFNSAYPSYTSSTSSYGSSTPLNTTGLISLSGAPIVPAGAPPRAPNLGLGVGSGAGVDEDGEGDDELFPAMADDDYSAQQSWNTQEKDNLKFVAFESHLYSILIATVQSLDGKFYPSTVRALRGLPAWCIGKAEC